MLGQMDQHAVVVGIRGIDDVVRLDVGILGGFQLPATAPSPGQAPPPQPVLADQQVEPQADPRLEEDDRKPCQTRGRLLLPQHDHRQHRQANDPFAGGQPCPEGDVHVAHGGFGFCWNHRNRLKPPAGASGFSLMGGEGLLISGGTSGASIWITKGRSN